MRERKLAKMFKQVSKELGDHSLRDFDISKM